MEESLWIKIVIESLGTFIALVGGFVVFICQEKIKAQNECKALATALLAEIECLEKVYYDLMAKDWVKTGDTVVSVTQNYFIVFEGNVNRLGLFRNCDSALIISFYIACKQFVEIFRAWHNFIWRLGQWEYEDVRIGEDKVNNHVSTQKIFEDGKKAYLDSVRRHEADLFERMCAVKKVLESYSTKKGRFKI